MILLLGYTKPVLPHQAYEKGQVVFKLRKPKCIPELREASFILHT